MVRRFARYCHAKDPRTVVPPPDLLPHRYRRVAPYIYSDEQIIDLLKAARQLPSTIGLQPQTYATLFGLYVASGLRANEALHLRREDVDLANGVLTIRDSKFGKTRFVPVHPSTRRALERYAKLRDRLCRTPADPYFFLSDRGTAVTYDMLRWTFVSR
jgi:integrase